MTFVMFIQVENKLQVKNDVLPDYFVTVQLIIIEM